MRAFSICSRVVTRPTNLLSCAPRITWDRITNLLTPRESAKRIAIVNGGTIPDRGLYGVYLAGAEKPTRLGELDEEMVFESKTGETIILGATTWRIVEITHDRVLVSACSRRAGQNALLAW